MGTRLSIFSLKSIQLRIVLLLLSVFYLVMGVILVWQWYVDKATVVALIVGLLFFIEVLGLFYVLAWPRLFSVLILWFFVFLFPFGIINPFYVGDLLAQGIEPPPLHMLVLRVVPIVACSLWCLHVLGKHKTEFRRQWLAATL